MAEHPISLEKAKELLAGDLGKVYRNILKGCCVPIYWFRLDTDDHSIQHNGTVTIVKTPRRVLGITAAHVIRQLSTDSQSFKVRVQLSSEVVDDVLKRVIDVSDKLDLATIDLTEEIIQRLGCTPLGDWPPRPPQEERGIMIAGYPAVERVEEGPYEVSFGLFTAIGIARTVTDTQITWLLEREYFLSIESVKLPPPQYELGGISGGPLIGWFESEGHVTHHCLSGIVVEHPDYKANKDMPVIERLIAIRADAIAESGKIGIA